ncbi:MAG TPA: lysylphosphatidylglycerol synthase domain-containing protein, partial [Stellaceae bacterium]|nr:lysylphosphatidylglycerol synthase domain-containing protein [Stellaceae bacterium]
IYHGIGPIFSALSLAGVGLLWAAAFHIVPMIPNTIGWRMLIVVGPKPSFFQMLYTVWVRESINGLLPVGRIGGELASYRVLTRMGSHATPVIVSLISDITLSLISQFLFTVLGLVLLLLRVEDADVAWRVFFGLLIFLPMLGGMIAMQRIGIGNVAIKMTAKLFGDQAKEFISDADLLDRMVRLVYLRISRVALSTLLQLLGWMLGAGELYWALYFLGHPATIADALMIEAVIQAISATLFVIPAAIGVQETAFVILCGLIGLPEDVGLALALARRFRDLVFFLPGLIVWQLHEVKHLVFRRRKGKRGKASTQPSRISAQVKSESSSDS